MAVLSYKIDKGTRPEECECRVVTITECFCRLSRIGLDEDGIRMRQGHRKTVQLTLNPADDPQCLSKIHLGVTGCMAQRNEDLF